MNSDADGIQGVTPWPKPVDRQIGGCVNRRSRAFGVDPTRMKNNRKSQGGL
jgi:hypothetical protein